MRPHPRIRKTIKWGGPVVAVAVVAIFALSTGRVWGWQSFRADEARAVYAVRGGIQYVHVRWIAANTPFFPEPSWVLGDRVEESLSYGIQGGVSPTNTKLFVPLWLPFLLVAIPTAIAWRLDTLARRREKHGACPSCGYDRSGLAPSSPCPECGTASVTTPHLSATSTAHH